MVLVLATFLLQRCFNLLYMTFNLFNTGALYIEVYFECLTTCTCVVTDSYANKSCWHTA